MESLMIAGPYLLYGLGFLVALLTVYLVYHSVAKAMRPGGPRPEVPPVSLADMDGVGAYQPPTQAEWLSLFEQKKGLLAPAADLGRYFSGSEYKGYPLHLIDIGPITIRSGKVMVCDPLAYLDLDTQPYLPTVPPGTFPVTVCAVEMEQDHYRYAAVKVDFSDRPAVRYTLALHGNEDLESIHSVNDIYGFPVDAGMAAILDTTTRDAFCEFRSQWEEQKGEDIYHSLLEAELERSSQARPDFQRPGGDWINFAIPGSDLTVPMFQTGFGDGYYPVYFGYDAQGEVCRLVVWMINIDEELCREEDEEEAA